MNGTISQPHKGGHTNKTSDQRPVVLFNSGYQLLHYIINGLLKRIVEHTILLELGQGGGKQGRSVTDDINMQKCMLSRMKPTDKESVSIESTSTSETPSMQCRRQLSGT